MSAGLFMARILLAGKAPEQRREHRDLTSEEQAGRSHHLLLRGCSLGAQAKGSIHSLP